MRIPSFSNHKPSFMKLKKRHAALMNMRIHPFYYPVATPQPDNDDSGSNVPDGDGDADDTSPSTT